MDRTFILTAELDPASFDWLDGLRRVHFPPARNLLPAHLTLFHRLSPAQTDRLGAISACPMRQYLCCATAFACSASVSPSRSPALNLSDCGLRCASPWAANCPGRTARAGGRMSPSRT